MIGHSEAVYSHDGTLLQINDSSENIGQISLVGAGGAHQMRLHTMQDEMLPSAETSILVQDSRGVAKGHHIKHNSSMVNQQLSISRVTKATVPIRNDRAKMVKKNGPVAVAHS